MPAHSAAPMNATDALLEYIQSRFTYAYKGPTAEAGALDEAYVLALLHQGARVDAEAVVWGNEPQRYRWSLHEALLAHSQVAWDGPIAQACRAQGAPLTAQEDGGLMDYLVQHKDDATLLELLKAKRPFYPREQNEGWLHHLLGQRRPAQILPLLDAFAAHPDAPTYLTDRDAAVDPILTTLALVSTPSKHRDGRRERAWSPEHVLACAQRLRAAGAPVDAETYEGDTSLHVAATEGCVPLIEFLVQEGADLEIMDGKNHTPLLAALASNLTPARLQATVATLLFHGARLDNGGEADYFHTADEVAEWNKRNKVWHAARTTGLAQLRQRHLNQALEAPGVPQPATSRRRMRL